MMFLAFFIFLVYANKKALKTTVASTITKHLMCLLTSNNDDEITEIIIIHLS